MREWSVEMLSLHSALFSMFIFVAFVWCTVINLYLSYSGTRKCSSLIRCKHRHIQCPYDEHTMTMTCLLNKQKMNFIIYFVRSLFIHVHVHVCVVRMIERDIAGGISRYERINRNEKYKYEYLLEKESDASKRPLTNLHHFLSNQTRSLRLPQHCSANA